MISTCPSTRPSLGVVVLLAVAGVFSGVLTTILVLNLWETYFQNDYVATAFSSLVLGLVIALVLGTSHVFQRGEKLLGFVAATVAAHLLERWLDSYFPQQGRPCWDCSPQGFFSSGTALRFLVVSLVAFPIGLVLFESRPKLSRVLAVGLGSSVVSSVAIGFLDSWAQWTHSDLFFNGMPLGLVWQAIFASAFGLSGWAMCLTGPNTSPKVEKLEDGKRTVSHYTGLVLCAIPLLVITVGGFVIMHRQAVAFEQKHVQIDAQIARSKLETPPPAELPKISSVPIEDLVVAKGIGDWKLYQQSSRYLDARRRGTQTIFPEREEYSGLFALADGDYQMNVIVTRYPDANWARYELNNTPYEDRLLRDQSVRLVIRSDGTLYSNGVESFWSSGDKLVFLTLEGILPDQVERILKAYLHKYPSDLRPTDPRLTQEP